MTATAAYLEALNNEIHAQGLSWRAEDTGISLEDLKIMCGYNPGPEELPFEERLLGAKARLHAGEHFSDSRLPAFVDHTKYMTSVQHQGNCGSCVAFGTIAAIEGTIRFQKNNPNYPVNLSEAHLFYCHAASEGRTCGSLLPNPWQGWTPDRALIAIKQKGLVDRTCFPYTPGAQPCKLCANWASSLTYISSFRKLSTIAEMKAALINNGPLISCMWAHEDFRTFSGNTVYAHVGGPIPIGGHCICIVGYDDTNKCWIGKNSWGTTWGNNGFFRIRYGECFIDWEMWAPYID